MELIEFEGKLHITLGAYLKFGNDLQEIQEAYLGEKLTGER